MSPLELSRDFNLRNTWSLSRSRLPSLAARMPDLPEVAVDLTALRALPITTKAVFAQHNEEWVAVNGTLPDYLVRTGGTSGRPVLRWGYLPARDTIFPAQPEGLLPLSVVSGSGRQGEIPRAGSRHGLIVTPLRDLEGYLVLIDLLGKTFQFKGFRDRISDLILPLPAVKKLVHLLLSRRVDCSAFAIEEVHTFSSFLSTRWRGLIEQVLGGKVVDHYGFTEIETARAVLCPHCQAYHFSDAVLPEVIDTQGRPVLDSGKSGRLLVTRLLDEDDRAMPVLRFDTGDLVELGPYCTLFKETGFRPWGKLDHSLLLHSDTLGDLYPVRYGDIQEALDAHPLVARIANIRHSLVTPTEGESFPKWRLRPAPAVGAPVLLEIEMLFDAALFRAAWSEFVDQLLLGISSTNPDYAKAVGQAGFQLEVVPLPPGTLRDGDVMKS